MRIIKNTLPLLCAVLFSILSASAQDVSAPLEGGNLNTMARNLPQIGVADGITKQPTDSTAIELATQKKPNFFRRIVDYYSRSNVDRTYEKKMDWSIVPGPNYSSDIGFGIGFLLAGLYRMDRTDSVTMPSNISIYGNVTTEKFVLLRASGENIFRKNRDRLNYSGAFVYFPGAFYGVGYGDGQAGYVQGLTTTMGIARIAYSHAVWSKLYLGVSGGIDYSGATYKNSGMVGVMDNIDKEVKAGAAIPEGDIGELYNLWQQGHYNPALQDPFSSYIASTGENPNAFNANVGVFALYDTRDVTFNASKGIFVKTELKLYPKFMGNTGRSFGRVSFTLDYYQKLWKGAVLAYDLYGDMLLGDPSWHMYAKLGGMERMRGYYEGRYRDKRMVETQVELRQKIYRRHGVVGWFGVGNIWGKDNFQWKNTLYSFGVGYRFEFKKRMNIRLDYGWGVFGNSNLPWDRKRSSAFLFTASEAF